SALDADGRAVVVARSPREGVALRLVAGLLDAQRSAVERAEEGSERGVGRRDVQDDEPIEGALAPDDLARPTPIALVDVKEPGAELVTRHALAYQRRAPAPERGRAPRSSASLTLMVRPSKSRPFSCEMASF